MFVDPEYRVMYAVGVDGSAGMGDIARREAREALFRTLREALAAIGVGWDDCHRDDLGDGMRLVLPSGIPKATLLYPFTNRLAACLQGRNSRHGVMHRVRARAALHAGDVYMTDGRMAGGSLEVLARLLDATPLRNALVAVPERTALVLLMSQHMHDEVVRPGGPGVDPEAFRRVRVTGDGAATDAWLHVPPPAVSDGVVEGGGGQRDQRDQGDQRGRRGSDVAVGGGVVRAVRAVRQSEEHIRQGG